MWEYVKGSEADFEGAPEWAVYLAEVLTCGKRVRAWEAADNKKYTYISGCYANEVDKIFKDGFINWIWSNKPVIIAERRKVDELQSRTNDEKLARDVAAVATLEQKGYEWCGGTLWKPPIGPVPDFILKEQQAFDTVQRPAHYNQSGIECIDAIAAAVKCKSGIEAALVSNVIKYLWRYELKNGVEDVRKAQWYLDRLVKELSK